MSESNYVLNYAIEQILLDQTKVKISIWFCQF